ncbi:hypothetical protein OAG71_05095, partial [bacterium]|nr:hypothetical protein [bacterium]
TLMSYLLLMIASSATSLAADKVDFESQIKPIFGKYCLECHGEEEEEAFRIDINSDMLLYVNEGHPETSDLYTFMTLEEDDDDLMPPVDHQPRPEPAEIQLVSAWIAQGASTSEADPSDGEASDTDASDADASDTNSVTADDVEPADGAAAAISPEEQRIYNAIGSLHTAAVHLPIGLLLAAGLFALFSLGGSFVMSDCAYYCLWLGTLGAIVASVSGWYYSPMEHRGTVTSIADLLDQTQPVYWHRLGGLISTVVALLLCLFAKGARGRNPDDGMMWKLGAILLAGAIGWVGHTGGELTYGKDHYKDLNELVDSVINPVENAEAPKAEDVDESEDADEADADQDDEAEDADETEKADASYDDTKEGDPVPTDI